MLGTILKYSDFFSDLKPKDKFSLVHDIPRCELIAKISSVNYVIKHPLDPNFNHSILNQVRMIESVYQVYLHSDNRIACQSHIDKLIENYKKYDGSCSIFTRVSCLFALNDVLPNTQFKNEKISEYNFSFEGMENILKFLLISNEELLEYDKNYGAEITSDKVRDTFFEAFMFKEIPHNQYYYIQNPINILQRAYKLFKYIESTYQVELMDFLKDYKIENPDDYLGILSKFLFTKDSSLPLSVFRVPISEAQDISWLDNLSKRGGGKPNTGIKKFEFLEIKKSPFYKLSGNTHNIYILMDSIFFMEKSYDLFFWDFYFDQLKEKGIKIEDWGSIVGYFFEEYADSIFKYSFEGHRDILYMSTDDLKINGVEYADFYIRRKRQIILVQAKRSFLPQEKYKEVYSRKDYEDLDKEAFYDRFGLNQLVEKSIAPFFEYAPKLDARLPKNKLFIYPVLLINEPIIAAAVTSFVFDRKFKELLSEKNIDIENRHYKIHRLTIIHISELERLQQSIRDKDIRLDKLIQTYVDNTNAELMKNDYASFRTFDNLIKKKIRGKAIPDYLSNKEGIMKKIIDFLNLK